MSNKLKALLNGVFEFIFGIGCFIFAWVASKVNPKIDARTVNPHASFARSFNQIAMDGFIVLGIVAFIFCMRSVQRFRSEDHNN